MLCRTKSRMFRIGEGDRNTSFFHRSVTIRKAYNRILCLRDDVGGLVEDPIEIRRHILKFYKNMYTSDHVVCHVHPNPGEDMLKMDVAPPLSRIFALRSLV